MDKINEFIEKVKKLNKKVVFPEGEDERILKAVSELVKEKIVSPVLLGDKEKIYNLARNIGINNISEVEIIEPSKSEYFLEFVERYCQKRKKCFSWCC